MKIEKLIEELQNIQSKHPNLNVIGHYSVKNDNCNCCKFYVKSDLKLVQRGNAADDTGKGSRKWDNVLLKF
jgi:hypothetical protein